MLTKDDIALQLNMLEAIEILFKSLNDKNVEIGFDETGGLSCLIELQQHPNSELANLSIKILDSFFSEEKI